MDKKSAPVEDFRVTEFEKKMQARLRQIGAVERALRAVGMQEMTKMRNIMDLYKQVTGAKEQLMALEPQVNELPGMEFGEKPEGQGGDEQPMLPPGAQPMLEY
jgi:hypothetical protein